tara:strand:+ start:179 stop:406 length:228 start_codon:yes stop_codon:yes gene_type:complete
MKKTDIIYGIHASVSALNNKKRQITEWKCTKEVFEKIKKKSIKKLSQKIRLLIESPLIMNYRINFIKAYLLNAKS